MRNKRARMRVFNIVTSDTAELLHWLGEEEEQAVAGSDPFPGGNDFGPDLEGADAELLEALSGLVSDLFTDWTH
jgi:hypothetical protein